MPSAEVVLIIAREDDLHALTVAWELRQRNVDSVIIDLADFPQRWLLSVYPGEGATTLYAVTLANGRTIASEAISGVWWRRTCRFQIPDTVRSRKHRQFCLAECRELIEGWILTLGTRVINPLGRERVASNKIHQLQMASACGLNVPSTLVTNDPKDVHKFHERHPSGLIYKILAAHGDMPTPFTRELTKRASAKLDHLVSGPSIFQETITGGLDIRVTLVDRKLFAAEIATSSDQARVDWRIDPNHITRPHRLPDDLVETLHRLHADLGLRYGAYDFRMDSAGAYWFLEVNTAGQYLWLETEAGHPISGALADALIQA